MMQNQAEDRIRLRRVLPERAIALAMQSRWSEAADVNRKIIELYPNDADAYNRLGKALCSRFYVTRPAILKILIETLHHPGNVLSQE